VPRLTGGIACITQTLPSSHHDSPYWTTNAGAPVYNNNQSLTVGVRGPVLLEDYHFIEKIAQVPESRTSWAPCRAGLIHHHRLAADRACRGDA